MKIFTPLLLFVFVGMFFLTFMLSSHSLVMSHGNGDCISASQFETFCPMILFSHIEVWKSVFMNSLPTLVVLMAVAIGATLVGKPPHLTIRIILYKIWILLPWLQMQMRRYGYTYRSLQDIFARGILHPKLF